MEANGNTDQHSFLTLPPEIRLRIYRRLLLLGCEPLALSSFRQRPRRRRDAHASGDRPYNICVRPSPDAAVDMSSGSIRPCLEILRVCRICYEEATPVLWGETCLNVPLWLDRSQPPLPCPSSMVQRLAIDLQDTDGSSGRAFREVWPYDTHEVLLAMRKFVPRLKELSALTNGLSNVSSITLYVRSRLAGEGSLSEHRKYRHELLEAANAILVDIPRFTNAIWLEADYQTEKKWMTVNRGIRSCMYRLSDPQTSRASFLDEDQPEPYIVAPMRIKEIMAITLFTSPTGVDAKDESRMLTQSSIWAGKLKYWGATMDVKKLKRIGCAHLEDIDFDVGQLFMPCPEGYDIEMWDIWDYHYKHGQDKVCICKRDPKNTSKYCQGTVALTAGHAVS